MNKLLGLTAAALLVCGPSFPQPQAAGAGDPEKQLLDRIGELKTAGGPTTASLIEPLGALGLMYQEDSRDAFATVAFEEARYVTRVQHGLASPDEALLLRLQIRSEKELGDFERVRDLEQEMVTIARRNHDDARMLPIFREVIDDRLALIEKVRAGERPRMIYVRCYNGEPLPPYDYTRGKWLPPVPPAGTTTLAGPNCIGGTNSQIADKLREEVLMYYADAIDTILRTGDFASLELRELETTALHMAYTRGGSTLSARESDESLPFPCPGATLDYYLSLEILGSCLAPVRRGPNFVIANIGGRVSLVRLLAYEMKSAAPAAARAAATVDLADWHMLAEPVERRRFSAMDELALSFYERAYDQLGRNGDAEESRAQIFAPEVPVTLPTFEANPFAAAANAQSPRYIDVAFAITKEGTSKQIDILDTSKDATRAEKRDLTRLIELTTFRPRVVDGEFAVAPVALRFHLAP